VFLAQSGPVAGVAAARRMGRSMQLRDIITGDMGGTSFDVSVIVGGDPLHRIRAELFGFWTGMVMVDVASIGAGGGSVAWIDERGMLRVGPRSAGARPGPAAYAQGGTEATITDALVVLGLLDPGYFLGGRIVLARDRAEAAVARVATALGVTTPAAAAGIYRMALEQMRGAIKALLVEKALDPRRFVFMSYGGCAGLFAAGIAAELGIPTVVVPLLASVFSAYGAAMADVRRDLSRTCFQAMPADPSAVRAVFDELSRQVREAVIAEGVAPDRVDVKWEADLRFRRQQWEVTVPLEPGPLTAATIARLEGDFRRRYEALYGPGTALVAAGVDLVNCRAVGIGRAAAPEAASGIAAESTGAEVMTATAMRRAEKPARRLAAALAPAGVPGAGHEPGPVVSVWDGEGLGRGAAVDGPALVERRDTTIYVPAGMRAVVDEAGSCILRRREGLP
jgi:N-methylhydantoinase A